MKRFIFAVIILLGMALFVSGCADTGTNNTENSSKNKTSSKDSVSVTWALNAKKGIKIPKGYPKDILPVHKGVKLVSAVKNEEDGAYAVVGDTNESVKNLAEYYDKVLKDAGASVISRILEEDTYTNIGQIKGNMYMITIGAATDERYKNMVSIVYTPKQ